MHGEVAAAREAIEDLTFPELKLDYDPSHYFFLQQRAFWNALADIELGVEPVWPDEIKDLIAPIEQQEMVDARQELLEAVHMYSLVNEDQGLVLLAESYAHLKKLARKEARAIIPFVYAAYTYGIAAFDAGEEETGAVALEEAVSRYPHGLNAERARTSQNPAYESLIEARHGSLAGYGF